MARAPRTVSAATASTATAATRRPSRTASTAATRTAPRAATPAPAAPARRRAAPAAPRTPRLVILPYGPSESVNSLANMLAEETADMDLTVLRMKREGSRFVGRAGDVLVNWGSRNEAFNTAKGAARTLNSIEAVTNAASKRRAFDLMREAGVSIVESTRDETVARGWFDAGFSVFARDEDSGHSGSGIRVMAREGVIPAATGTESVPVVNTFSASPLYTKGAYIGQAHREYRVHVMNGKVIFLQQKKRRAEWREMDTYSNIIRNYHTGWIYANEDVTPLNDAGLYHAVKAVEALGLDFGAVDVMTRGEDAKVLEVNTAPGLSGTNLRTYTCALIKFFKGEEVEQAQGITVPTVDPLLAIAERLAAEEAAAAAAALAPEIPVVTRNFVKVIVNHEESVGYYDADLNAFILAGFDVPMEPSDVVVIADSI